MGTRNKTAFPRLVRVHRRAEGKPAVCLAGEHRPHYHNLSASRAYAWENHLAPRHPLDAYLQHRAVVKVVGTGPSLQGGEGHVAPSERGNVTELVRAQGLLLVLASPDEAAVHLEVGVLAGAAVVLVRDPGPIFPCALVNGEALWPAGVEPEAHVCDVKRFSYGTNTSKFISHV